MWNKIILILLMSSTFIVGCADPPKVDPCENISCKAGETCKEGKCVAGCADGETSCDGACVNTSTATKHCGACGKSCADGEACSAGKCIKDCPKDTRKCGDQCIDVASSTAHCGKCDNKCSDKESCDAGSCKAKCPVGQTSCDGSCVDLQADAKHCGTCGTTCQSDEVCQAGKCESKCKSGQIECSGACVDTQSSTAHCGKCGNACDSDEECQSGQCKPLCPAGEKLCAKACVKTQLSPEHCGACGNVCAKGQLCFNGTCAGSWAQSASSTTKAADERGYTLTVDQKNGDIYVAGKFSKSIVIGKITLTSDRDNSFFVARFDNRWQPIWAKAVNANTTDSMQMLLDGSGHLYMGGTFYSTSATFGTTTVNNPHYVDTSGRKRYNSRMFVAKMKKADGQWIWAVGGGANAQITTDGIAINSKGNLYVTGTFVTQKGFEKATIGATELKSKGGAEIYIARLDKDGKWLWARAEGSSSNDYARAIAIDAQDNVYLGGYFLRTMTLGSTTLTPRGGYDGFVAKMDNNNKWLWAKSFAGSNTLQDMGVDQGGSVYAVGHYNGAVSLGTTCRVTGYRATDIFIVKLTTDGNCAWMRRAGGTGTDVPTDIHVNDKGEMALIARFYDQAAFGSTTLKATKDFQIAVAKLDAGGNFLWAKSAGSRFNELGHGIALDGKGGVHITGYYNNEFNAGTKKLSSPESSNNIFVASLSDKGDFTAAATFEGTDGGYEYIAGTTRDKDGNLYIAGQFSGTITIGKTKLTAPTSNNGTFVASLDDKGNWRWAKEIKNSKPDNNDIEINAIAVNRDGTVAITGVGGESEFGSLKYKGRENEEDIFVATIDKDGKWLWVTGGGGKGGDAEGKSIAIDDDGNVYVAGKSYPGTIGGITFAPGGSHIIVGKLDKTGKWLWITAGGESSDRVEDIAVDANGQVVITGRLYFNNKAINFGAITLPDKGRGRTVFVARLDKDGKWLWVAQSELSSSPESHAITLDGSGQAYIAGSFEKTLKLGSSSITSRGQRDSFVAVVDKDGKWQWSRSFGNKYTVRSNDITLDAKGNILLTGSFQGAMAVEQVELTSNTSESIAFVLALDSKGKALWGTNPRFKRPTNNSQGFGGTGIATMPNGAVAIVGQYGGQVSFGTTELNSTGRSDLFVWMLIPPQ